MNEQIRELAEQAKAYANESTKDFTGDEPVVWMDYYTERFAELIVKECADIADKAEPYKANDLIKQHFGVEE